MFGDISAEARPGLAVIIVSGTMKEQNAPLTILLAIDLDLTFSKTFSKWFDKLVDSEKFVI